MKQICILLFIIPLFFFSCNDDDDEIIKTELPCTFSLSVDESSVVNPEAAQLEYSFSATETYSLSENEDLKDYLDRINNISALNFEFGIAGLEDGENINKVEITAKGSDALLTIGSPTISETGESWPVGGYIGYGEDVFSDNQITLTVNGTTNSAPMDFDLNILLQLEATAEEL